MTGDYLEVRSCDVYTGSCVANSEMGLSGREGMLVWSVRSGEWKGVSLAGLKVIAVVHTEDTLGDVKYFPREGKAVLIVDANANSEQAAALQDFVKAMAGPLVREVVAVKPSTERPSQLGSNNMAFSMIWHLSSALITRSWVGLSRRALATPLKRFPVRASRAPL